MNPRICFIMFVIMPHLFVSVMAGSLSDQDKQFYLASFERHLEAFASLSVPNAPDISVLRTGLKESLSQEQMLQVMNLACNPPASLPDALRLSVAELACVVSYNQQETTGGLIIKLKNCSPMGLAAVLYSSAFLPEDSAVAGLALELAEEFSLRKPEAMSQHDYAMVCDALFAALKRNLNEIDVVRLHNAFAYKRLSPEFSVALLAALVDATTKRALPSAEEWIDEIVLLETNPATLRMFVLILAGNPSAKNSAISQKINNISQLQSVLSASGTDHN